MPGNANSAYTSMLKYFSETYELNRDKVHTFFPPGVMPVRWSFDFDRVFMRFNTYMQRLKMVEDIVAATVEILKLEKVEFSGLRGKTLSTECLKVRVSYFENLFKLLFVVVSVDGCPLLDIIRPPEITAKYHDLYSPDFFNIVCPPSGEHWASRKAQIMITGIEFLA